MARLVHVNGPPGVGKSTLAAIWAERHPGTLNLDVDAVHRLVGGWQQVEIDTWPVVGSLVWAMAATHLDGGHDVLVAQYHATADEIGGLEELARSHGADFREVVLLASRDEVLARFEARARTTDDPWVRHHYRLLEENGGTATLGAMYDRLMDVISLRPEAIVVPSPEGAIEQTYEALLARLG